MKPKDEISPKNYLGQLEMQNTFISQKKAEKERVKKEMEDISGISHIERMEKLEHLIDEEVVAIAEERHKIINEIQSLSKERHVDILYRHYVQFKTLVEIADEKNYTYDYVKKLHGYALAEFGNKFLKK